MKTLLVCISLAVVIALAYAKKTDDEKWADYKRKHAKSYGSPEEEAKRKEIFLAKEAVINSHNEDYENGKASYKKGHSPLSDRTQKELDVLNGARNIDAQLFTTRTKRGASTTCYRYNATSPCFWKYSADTTVTRPASVDLRTTGWTESVRDQGQCGSCWAFSTSSVMSYYQFKKLKVNYVFSPQNLVDCDGIWNASGCNGASPAQAFEYFEMNKQNLEADYPYGAVQKACTRPLKSLFNITGFYQLASDQASLEQALSQLGAVVVSIDANGLSSYGSGVWNGNYKDIYGNPKVCSSTAVNHAVTAVGYGTDAATGKKYWLIKNSWGSNWGESGYFRMERNISSVCGIYKYAYTVF